MQVKKNPFDSDASNAAVRIQLFFLLKIRLIYRSLDKIVLEIDRKENHKIHEIVSVASSVTAVGTCMDSLYLLYTIQ